MCKIGCGLFWEMEFDADCGVDVILTTEDNIHKQKTSHC